MEALLQQVLDLTDGAVLRVLKLSERQLVRMNWRKQMAARREPLTQRLGRAAHACGVEGLLLRSAADPKGRNLLVFPDNLRSGSTLQILNVDELKAF